MGMYKYLNNHVNIICEINSKYKSKKESWLTVPLDFALNLKKNDILVFPELKDFPDYILNYSDYSEIENFGIKIKTRVIDKDKMILYAIYC
jgi:hypothetical protein